MEICFPDRCAVTQLQCSAKLLLARCTCPLLRAAVQNRLTAGLYHCKNTYGYFLSIQVVQWLNSSARTRCFWQSAVAPCSVLLCKDRLHLCRLVAQPLLLANTCYGVLLCFPLTGCAVAQQQCKATLLLAKCSCPLLSAAVQTG